MKRIHFFVVAIILSIIVAEGKVVHLRPGVELPVTLSPSMQSLLSNPSVTISGYNWSTTNSNISVRSQSRDACVLYTSSMLNGGEATLKYWVIYLGGYKSEKYEYSWTIKVSPRGEKIIWGDLQDGDYFHDYTEEDHLMLFYVNTGCAVVTSYRNGSPCISKSVKGKVTIPEYSQGYPVSRIYEDSFKGLSEITDLVLPSTLKSVDYNSIYGCSKLQTLTCQAKTPPSIVMGKSFDGSLLSNTILIVPKGCKNQYKEAKGWKEFKKIKEIGQSLEDIHINESNFPDEAFRNQILTYDEDNDKFLSDDEISLIQNLYLYGLGITSLQGIEYLYSLEELNCSNNQITELDLSKNTDLKVLYCGGNPLKSLDVSKYASLEWLNCRRLQLTSLNVSNNKALKELDCGDNALTSLNVSNNTVLEGLSCDENQLTSLDLSKNTTLKSLYCEDNKLSSLDLSRNTSLNSLNCSINQLSSLDLSQNRALTRLDFHNNRLVTIDLSQNTALSRLVCSTNQLAELDLEKNTALDYLNCSNNQLTALNISRNTLLTELICSTNPLTSLDISRNTELKSMNCYNDQLTALDVSKNTALISLDCSDNLLTSLDVSNNTALTSIDCYFNIIKGTAMDNLVYSLPTNLTDKVRVLNIVGWVALAEGNVCTSVQVATAQAKGWSVCRINRAFTYEYEGSDPNAFGDVTDDGKVDFNDLDKVAQYIMTPQKSYIDMKRLDINADRKVNAADIVRLLNEIKITTK